MFRYHPGVIHKGDGSDQRPVAIVTASRERMEAYVSMGPMGPWVWVRELGDMPEEPLGGAAFLDTDPVSVELRDALLAACLAT